VFAEPVMALTAALIVPIAVTWAAAVVAIDADTMTRPASVYSAG
jgi:hypothetical protein